MIEINSPSPATGSRAHHRPSAAALSLRWPLQLGGSEVDSNQTGPTDMIIPGPDASCGVTRSLALVWRTPVNSGATCYAVWNAQHGRCDNITGVTWR